MLSEIYIDGNDQIAAIALSARQHTVRIGNDQSVGADQRTRAHAFNDQIIATALRLINEYGGPFYSIKVDVGKSLR